MEGNAVSDQPDDKQPDAEAELSPLERAAAMGPLPGIEAEEAAEERGEDTSWTPDDRHLRLFARDPGGAVHGD